MKYKKHRNPADLEAGGIFPAHRNQEVRIDERRRAAQLSVVIEDTEFVVFPGVYKTGVDTRLMNTAVKLHKEDHVLEVGCGCGAVTLLSARRCCHVVGVDINALAVANSNENAKRLQISNADFFVSDVFSDVDDEYDVIICNPPYNEHRTDGRAQRMFWDEGDNMKRRFFEDVSAYLKAEGHLYFGWGDFSDLDVTLPIRLARQHGLDYIQHFSAPSSNGAQCFYVIEFALREKKYRAPEEGGCVSLPSVADPFSATPSLSHPTHHTVAQNNQRPTEESITKQDYNARKESKSTVSAILSHPDFVDLFCGVGGFRLAFESAGCQCVWSCDNDPYCARTYLANFGENPASDIYSVELEQIPRHDILCAGFPCPAFSIAGVSKKQSLGRKHGFHDKKHGNLFFAIAEILDVHRPAAFVLENVKHIKYHDGGRTYRVILDTLTGALGYTVYEKIIDAQSLVPQHRERTFIVGFREQRYFEFPLMPAKGPKLDSILESDVPAKYTISDRLWTWHQDHASKHRAAGHGFSYGLVTKNDIARTLSARYFKDGAEILVSQGPKKAPRRLTPRECSRLMGFPENFKIVVSDTQAYKQFGNAVVVPVVELIAKAVVETLNRPVDEGFVLR